MTSMICCALFLLNITNNTFTGGECDFPPPEEIHVVALTTNTVELSWEPFADAYGYWITIVDLETGELVFEGPVDEASFSFDELAPGTQYDISISSLCRDGSPGQSSSLRVETNIIIGDIVMHMECDDSSQGSSQYSSGSIVQYPFSSGDALAIEGSIINGPDFAVGFLVQAGAITPNYQITGAAVAGASSAPMIVDVAQGGNFGKIKYDTGNGGLELLAWFDILSGQLGPHVQIRWNKHVSGVYPSSCMMADGPGSGKSRLSQTEEQALQLQISPNPIVDIINIKGTLDSPINIYDLKGIKWTALSLEAGRMTKIDASQWPSGMYILQYFEAGQSRTTTFVKI